MPIIDFSNSFWQTSGMSINNKSGNGMLKETDIDTNSKQYQVQAEVSKKRDSLEISSAAYGRNATEKTMSATSGKDVLGITKGDTDNSFVIHFSDSAMVSRAVSRGYITVNGVELKLSEETKQQLLKVDEQAKTEREKAYNDYVMQHEMAVAKQQSETLKNAFGNVADTIDIFEEFFGTKAMPKEYESALKAYENTQGGVSWSQFEWKTFDTQMKVSVKDTIKIEDISKGTRKFCQVPKLNIQDKLIKVMEHENRNEADTGAAIEKRLSLEKRLGEVEKVIAKLYEDYALGKAGADEIDLLLPKYRKEQGELKGQLALFQEESNEQKETAQNAEKWVALIRQYSDLQELTTGIIRELITKIYVGDVRKVDGEKVQSIEIHYRFIGRL